MYYSRLDCLIWPKVLQKACGKTLSPTCLVGSPCLRQKIIFVYKNTSKFECYFINMSTPLCQIVVAARRVFCFAFCQNAIQLSVKTDENGQWDTKLLQMDDHRAIYSSKLDKKIHIGRKYLSIMNWNNHLYYFASRSVLP